MRMGEDAVFVIEPPGLNSEHKRFARSGCDDTCAISYRTCGMPAKSFNALEVPNVILPDSDWAIICNLDEQLIA